MHAVMGVIDVSEYGMCRLSLFPHSVDGWKLEKDCLSLKPRRDACMCLLCLDPDLNKSRVKKNRYSLDNQ